MFRTDGPSKEPASPSAFSLRDSDRCCFRTAFHNRGKPSPGLRYRRVYEALKGYCTTRPNSVSTLSTDLVEELLDYAKDKNPTRTRDIKLSSTHRSRDDVTVPIKNSSMRSHTRLRRSTEGIPNAGSSLGSMFHIYTKPMVPSSGERRQKTTRPRKVVPKKSPLAKGNSTRVLSKASIVSRNHTASTGNTFQPSVEVRYLNDVTKYFRDTLSLYTKPFQRQHCQALLERYHQHLKQHHHHDHRIPNSTHDTHVDDYKDKRNLLRVDQATQSNSRKSRSIERQQFKNGVSSQTIRNRGNSEESRNSKIFNITRDGQIFDDLRNSRTFEEPTISKAFEEPATSKVFEELPTSKAFEVPTTSEPFAKSRNSQTVGAVSNSRNFEDTRFSRVIEEPGNDRTPDTFDAKCSIVEPQSCESPECEPLSVTNSLYNNYTTEDAECASITSGVTIAEIVEEWLQKLPIRANYTDKDEEIKHYAKDLLIFDLKKNLGNKSKWKIIIDNCFKLLPLQLPLDPTECAIYSKMMQDDLLNRLRQVVMTIPLESNFKTFIKAFIDGLIFDGPVDKVELCENLTAKLIAVTTPEIECHSAYLMAIIEELSEWPLKSFTGKCFQQTRALADMLKVSRQKNKQTLQSSLKQSKEAFGNTIQVWVEGLPFKRGVAVNKNDIATHLIKLMKTVASSTEQVSMYFQVFKNTAFEELKKHPLVDSCDDGVKMEMAAELATALSYLPLENIKECRIPSTCNKDEAKVLAEQQQETTNIWAKTFPLKDAHKDAIVMNLEKTLKLVLSECDPKDAKSQTCDEKLNTLETSPIDFIKQKATVDRIVSTETKSNELLAFPVLDDPGKKVIMKLLLLHPAYSDMTEDEIETIIKNNIPKYEILKKKGLNKFMLEIEMKAELDTFITKIMTDYPTKFFVDRMLRGVIVSLNEVEMKKLVQNLTAKLKEFNDKSLPEIKDVIKQHIKYQIDALLEKKGQKVEQNAKERLTNKLFQQIIISKNNPDLCRQIVGSNVLIRNNWTTQLPNPLTKTPSDSTLYEGICDILLDKLKYILKQQRNKTIDKKKVIDEITQLLDEALEIKNGSLEPSKKRKLVHKLVDKINSKTDRTSSVYYSVEIKQQDHNDTLESNNLLQKISKINHKYIQNGSNSKECRNINIKKSDFKSGNKLSDDFFETYEGTVNGKESNISSNISTILPMVELSAHLKESKQDKIKDLPKDSEGIEKASKLRNEIYFQTEATANKNIQSPDMEELLELIKNTPKLSRCGSFLPHEYRPFVSNITFNGPRDLKNKLHYEIKEKLQSIYRSNEDKSNKIINTFFDELVKTALTDLIHDTNNEEIHIMNKQTQNWDADITPQSSNKYIYENLTKKVSTDTIGLHMQSLKLSKIKTKIVSELKTAIQSIIENQFENVDDLTLKSKLKNYLLTTLLEDQEDQLSSNISSLLVDSSKADKIKVITEKIATWIKEIFGVSLYNLEQDEITKFLNRTLVEKLTDLEPECLNDILNQKDIRNKIFALLNVISLKLGIKINRNRKLALIKKLIEKLKNRFSRAEDVETKQNSTEIFQESLNVLVNEISELRPSNDMKKNEKLLKKITKQLSDIKRQTNELKGKKIIGKNHDSRLNIGNVNNFDFISSRLNLSRILDIQKLKSIVSGIQADDILKNDFESKSKLEDNYMEYFDEIPDLATEEHVQSKKLESICKNLGNDLVIAEIEQHKIRSIILQDMRDLLNNTIEKSGIHFDSEIKQALAISLMELVKHKTEFTEKQTEISRIFQKNIFQWLGFNQNFISESNQKLSEDLAKYLAEVVLKESDENIMHDEILFINKLVQTALDESEEYSDTNSKYQLANDLLDIVCNTAERIKILDERNTSQYAEIIQDCLQNLPWFSTRTLADMKTIERISETITTALKRLNQEDLNISKHIWRTKCIIRENLDFAVISKLKKYIEERLLDQSDSTDKEVIIESAVIENNLKQKINDFHQCTQSSSSSIIPEEKQTIDTSTTLADEITKSKKMEKDHKEIQFCAKELSEDHVNEKYTDLKIANHLVERIFKKLSRTSVDSGTAGKDQNIPAIIDQWVQEITELFPNGYNEHKIDEMGSNLKILFMNTQSFDEINKTAIFKYVKDQLVAVFQITCIPSDLTAINILAETLLKRVISFKGIKNFKGILDNNKQNMTHSERNQLSKKLFDQITTSIKNNKIEGSNEKYCKEIFTANLPGFSKQNSINNDACFMTDQQVYFFDVAPETKRDFQINKRIPFMIMKTILEIIAKNLDEIIRPTEHTLLRNQIIKLLIDKGGLLEREAEEITYFVMKQAQKLALKALADEMYLINLLNQEINTEMNRSDNQNHISAKERENISRGIPEQEASSQEKEANSKHVFQTFNTTITPSKNLAQYIEEWCNNLLIQGHSEQVKAIKQILLSKLLNTIGELNTNPDIFNDEELYKELIYDEINKLLLDLPRNTELDRHLPNFVQKLISSIVRARQIMLIEKSGKCYKSNLKNAIHNTLPIPLSLPMNEVADLELLEDIIADAFLNSHTKNKCDGMCAFIQKKSDDIRIFYSKIRYCFPYTPNTNQLAKDLHNALLRIPVPQYDLIKSEVEQAVIRDIITKWMQTLPLRQEPGTDKLHRYKLATLLAKKLYDLETEKEQNPHFEVHPKMCEQITKFLEKVPLDNGDSQIPEFTQNLISELKESENKMVISSRCTTSDNTTTPFSTGDTRQCPPENTIPHDISLRTVSSKLKLIDKNHNCMSTLPSGCTLISQTPAHCNMSTNTPYAILTNTISENATSTKATSTNCCHLQNPRECRDTPCQTQRSIRSSFGVGTRDRSSGSQSYSLDDPSGKECFVRRWELRNIGEGETEWTSSTGQGAEALNYVPRKKRGELKRKIWYLTD